VKVAGAGASAHGVYLPGHHRDYSDFFWFIFCRILVNHLLIHFHIELHKIQIIVNYPLTINPSKQVKPSFLKKKLLVASASQ